MPVDTLAPSSALVTLAAPVPGTLPTPSGSPADVTASYQQVSWAALPGQDEVVVASLGLDSAGHGRSSVLSAYSLSGVLLFHEVMNVSGPVQHETFTTTLEGTPSVAAVGSSGEFAFNWNTYTADNTNYQPQSSGMNVDVLFHPDGSAIFGGPVVGGSAAELFTASFGLRVVAADPFNVYDPSGPVVRTRDLTPDFNPTAYPGTPGLFIPAYADILVGGAEFTVTDNQARLAGSAAVALPGEPANAVTDIAAAGLANGATAAVAYADSGTAYVALYDKATNNFGDRIGLDWGGAGDLHLVALADGGFVVSWDNGGAYKGEVFDAAGNGGGIISLAGNVAGIDSHGDLYTVGLNASGAEVVQTYAINGGSSGGGGGTTGQTFTSDNAGDTWQGTTGNDIFNLGRGGDHVAGGGGDDTFKFAEVPWTGGYISDFNAGDVLDLSGLVSTTADTGTDGLADGYIQLVQTGSNDTQVWARYATTGDNSGWWLVTTLQKVAAANLLHSGNLFSISTPGGGGGGDSTDVTTSDANYVAAASVTSITLTGSQQTIDAGATHGVTINSNDTGNTLTGGAGDDVFHLGRGGDTVTGGAGADTFAYAATPWAAGRIKDFSTAQGDKIDLTGLLAASGYTGSDAIKDGYLKIVDTVESAAQIWSDTDGPGGASGWWLVVSTNQVHAGALKYSNGVVTGGGDGSVVVEEQQYVSLGGVTSITLAGAGGQTIISEIAAGITFIDNNAAGNTLIGGGGPDTFILGTGGTSVSLGSGGADTIVINAVPSLASTINAFTPGNDRIDLHGLLASLGSIGPDPFHDGHLELITDINHNTWMLAYDPSTSNWDNVAEILNVSSSQLHYADGWLS